MNNTSQAESILTRHRRRRTGLFLMTVPFMLTFSLHLWFSAVAFLQGKLGDFSTALTWSTLVFQALSSPYMVLTLPIMLGGLWIYQRPLNVCSTLYAVLTGCAYFVVALICSYIAIGYVV